MTSGHLVQECGEAISAALDKAEAVELLYLAPAEKAAALVELARLESRVAATRLRLMAVADEVAEEAGDRDVAAWCQRTVRVDRGPARRDLTLARSLAHRWTVLAGAHSAGEVSTAQADVIARALDDLPTETPADMVAEAERVLVEHAATFTPKELRVLGRRILDVVAPDVGEEQERRRLEDEERRARKTTSLTTRSHGDGTTTIRIRVPDATADRLLTYLHAWTNPRKDNGESGDDGRPVRDAVHGPARARVLRPARAPRPDPAPRPRRHRHHGRGDHRPRHPHQRPRGGDHRHRRPDHRRRGPPAGVHRPASSPSSWAGPPRSSTSAGPGGSSPPPSAGRSGVRDGHCRAEGCDIPAAWCEAHHLTPWSEGGRTDLDNAILLCSHHHHRAHDDRYLHDRLPDGDVRFHRRR